MNPPTSVVSPLSTTASGCAPTGLIKSQPGTTWISISDAFYLLVFHFSSLLFHNNMDGFYVSLHRPPVNHLLSVQGIPTALSAFCVYWPTNHLHSTSTAKTGPSSNLLTDQGTSGICARSSHGICSNRIPCFVATD